MGVNYFEKTIEKLKQFENSDFDKIVHVMVDLSSDHNGKLSFGGILMQAKSQAIHHFESVGDIIFQLDIQFPNEDFILNSNCKLNNYIQCFGI